VFSNLYQAGYLDVLWATCDVTRGDFCHTLGMEVAVHLEVPLKRFPNTPNRLIETFSYNDKVELESLRQRIDQFSQGG
jgi:hypothetical protein